MRLGSTMHLGLRGLVILLGRMLPGQLPGKLECDCTGLKVLVLFHFQSLVFEAGHFIATLVADSSWDSGPFTCSPCIYH